jgi:hypothetical protein
METFDYTERVLPYWQTILAMHEDQHYGNFEWLRDRDKKQVVQSLGTAGGVSPILVNNAGPFNITNLLTVPTNDYEVAQWALIGMAEVQRAANATARVSFSIAVTGGSGGAATDGTYEFFSNNTLRGSFVQCVQTRQAAINEALQFRMVASRVAGSGDLNIYRASLLAVRIA